VFPHDGGCKLQKGNYVKRTSLGARRLAVQKQVKEF
jgi:hypothetical protein